MLGARVLGIQTNKQTNEATVVWNTLCRSWPAPTPYQPTNQYAIGKMEISKSIFL